MFLKRLGLALIVGCAHAAPQQPAQISSASDETDVQSVVVNEFARGAQSLVVLDMTVIAVGHYGDDHSGALTELGALAPGLRRDFDTKSGERVRVLPLSAQKPVRLVSKASLDSVMATARDPGDYWNKFYAQFPGAFGRIALSRVGFSTDRKQALVLADYGCGGRCGGTRYYLLERTTNGWRILRMAQTRFV